jgi:hypothetical protein
MALGRYTVDHAIPRRSLVEGSRVVLSQTTMLREPLR